MMQRMIVAEPDEDPKAAAMKAAADRFVKRKKKGMVRKAKPGRK